MIFSLSNFKNILIFSFVFISFFLFYPKTSKSMVDISNPHIEILNMSCSLGTVSFELQNLSNHNLYTCFFQNNEETCQEIKSMNLLSKKLNKNNMLNIYFLKKENEVSNYFIQNKQNTLFFQQIKEWIVSDKKYSMVFNLEPERCGYSLKY